MAITNTNRPSYVALLSEKRQAKFWLRVDKNGENGCWNWIGSLTDQGYGTVYVHPRSPAKGILNSPPHRADPRTSRRRESI